MRSNHNFRKDSNNYKRELLNYKKSLSAIQRENTKYQKKRKNKKIKSLPYDTAYDTFSDFQIAEDNGIIKTLTENLLNFKANDTDIDTEIEDNNINNKSIEEQIYELEKKRQPTFKEEIEIEEETDLFEQDCFLYHGLRYYDHDKRFQEGLKKLESILEKQNILAGKYLEDYYPYTDNCNEGEYVSLMRYNDSIEFSTFVKPNISLIVSPYCEAIKTTYVPCDTWDYLKKNNITLKNRYSYANEEYQVKDHIPLSMIRAIAIPYFSIRMQQGLDVANELYQNIKALLEKYNIDLPIVDIERYNQIIFPSSKIYKKIKN